MSTPSPTDPRRLHYGEFYDLKPLPVAGERPFVIVVGNCQAESLRILLDSTGEVASVRTPAIHEWTGEDLGRAQTLVARADALIMQPVRDDYRGLACGSAQLSRHLPAHGRLIGFPVLRFDGLMPYQAIIRSPSNPSLNPPLLPYHDLRVLAAARGITQTEEPSAENLRTLAAMSVDQLRRRERAHDTVSVSEHLEHHPVWHTINHPDNGTLTYLAQQVCRALSVEAAPGDPGRELLGGLEAPVEKRAAAALGVDLTGRDSWLPEPEGWEQAHLEFYADNPDVVAAGVDRHGERMRLLGLGA